MFAAAAATTAAGISVLPIAAKAAGELHRTVFESNLFARQGRSLPDEAGVEKRLARQRVGGISGGAISEEPDYMAKTPKRASRGDSRSKFLAKKGESPYSSKSVLDDILAKVPNQTAGTESYKRISRPRPTRSDIFNQAFLP